MNVINPNELTQFTYISSLHTKYLWVVKDDLKKTVVYLLYILMNLLNIKISGNCVSRILKNFLYHNV